MRVLFHSCTTRMLVCFSFVALIAIPTLAIKRFPSDQFSRGRDVYEAFFESQEKQTQWQNESGDFDQRSSHRRTDETTAESHLVTSLPLLVEELSTKHYAGHIPASSDDDKKLFYWLFYPDAALKNVKDEDIPLLIWLNGGPGCSSMDGLFLENGPFRFDESDTKIYLNPYSWHKAPAYVLYVDQPVGTGLSFTKKKKYCKTDEEINIDFYFFLNKFFQLHSDVMLKSNKKGLKRPFFFAGESHAGHYIPSMITYIHSKNQANPDISMPVSGAAIGNGWVDPYYQYSASDVAYGAGLIDLSQKAKLDQMEVSCHRDMTEKHELASNTCYDLQGNIIDNVFGLQSKYEVSPYDYNLSEPKKSPRKFPPGHKLVESYLGGWKSKYHPIVPTKYKDVLKAIHASESISANQRYLECTDPPYYALAEQEGLGVINDVESILETGNTRLLFFNGMNDIICNHVGNERFLENMKWKGTKNWITSERYAWGNIPHGKSPAGYVKEYQNLIYLKVREAGHMVPLDQPRVSLDMISTFMYGLDFGRGDRAQSSLQRIDNTVDSQSEVQCQPCPTCEVDTSKDEETDTSKAKDTDTSEDEETDTSKKESQTSEKALLVHGNEDINVSKAKQFIAEGWLGAIIGACLIISVFVWKQKRDTEHKPVYDASFDGDDIEETEITIQEPYED